MSEEDYELRWPREILREELGALVNNTADAQWRDRVAVVLTDAFTTARAADDFVAIRTVAPVRDPWTTPADPWAEPLKPAIDPAQRYVADLLSRLDTMAYEGTQRPYYSQRKAGSAAGSLSTQAVAAGVRALALDLDRRGYFERAFGKDCPDDPADQTPAGVISLRLGRDLEWIAPAEDLTANPADLFDLIEVLHDFAAFPRARRYHDWSDCGWHHSAFATGVGRGVYRWAMNRILDRSDLGIRLADDGDDRGRLVATTDPDRGLLSRQMVMRQESETGDPVRHAMSLFRRRAASEHDKRSACIALAGVLEQRRDLLKDKLMRKDEGALFHIANSFAIRHQAAQQQGDYDPAFLDWVYWVYLATIELTDRLLERDAT